MSDPITPDQQGAGVVTSPAEPMTQGGLMDAIRSRGTLPAVLPPQMLAQSMQQEGPGPSGGLAVGSGMLNALSGGNAAQNPYLQHYQAQQNAQVQQGLQYQQLQRQQQDADRQQNALSLTIMQNLLPNLPEGPAREQVAKQYSGLVSRVTGLPQAGDLAQALATKQVSSADVNNILLDAAGGMTPEMIAVRHPMVPLAKIQQILQIDPKTLERMGLETEQSRRAKAADLRSKEIDAWSKERGIKLDDAVHARMMTLAQGRSLLSMTDGEIALLRAQAEKSVSDETLTKKISETEQVEGIKHKNKMAEIQAQEELRRANPSQNPELKPAIVKLQQEYQTLTLPDDRPKQIKSAVELLNKEGLLPTGPTLFDYTMASARGATKINRPDIAAAWDTLRRFGTPLLLDAERQLAGQPIGAILRLKAVAEAEVGGIQRVPKEWWDTFFKTYDAQKNIRKETVAEQLRAMGVTPRASASPLTPNSPTLSPAQRSALKAAGYSDTHIEVYMRSKGMQ